MRSSRSICCASAWAWAESLQNATIATLGERVKDVFFITDADNQPLSDPELCLRSQEAIVVTQEPGVELTRLTI